MGTCLSHIHAVNLAFVVMVA